MPRYHINPETGRPNVCNAKTQCRFAVDGKEPEHYASKDEARKGYELSQVNETIPESLTKGAGEINSPYSSSGREKREKLRDTLREYGYKISLYGDCALELYHEGENEPPAEVRSYEAANGLDNEFIDKPKGALWLSPGVKGDGNKVATAWGEWTTGESWGMVKNPKVAKAEISADALILEINDSNYHRVAGALEGEPWRYVKSYPSQYEEIRARIDGQGVPMVPWAELKAAGVDMVRVNGAYNRNHFYGWDCDSVVVLNGDVMRGWSFEEAERDGDKISKIWGNIEYTLPLEAESNNN